MAEASAQQAQQQAREDSRKKNLTLRKARKAAKGAEEKLAQGQHAEALSRFKISYKVFGEAGIDHVKIREKIIALDPGWNPTTAEVSPDGTADSKVQRQPYRNSDADSEGGARSAKLSPVKKLDISSELADREEVPPKLGGERGWADYTPPSGAKSAFGNGSSPSLLQRVHEAGKRVQPHAGHSVPSETSPAAASTRVGTFLYSAVSPAATGSVDGESHLMSVRPVGDQQASALRPPRARPSSQRSSRSPPQTRPGSGQRLRDSMPTSATPYTTPRAAGSSSMFVPSTGSKAQATRYSREYEFSGRSSANTYRHRSPSPSSTGRPGWRGTSPFDKRKRQELTVKFDWSAALLSSEKLFHRIRVNLPSDDDELRPTRPEPSWSAAVSQQVLFHGIGEQDVAFSFVDDEEDECRITSEDEWLAALRIQEAKGGPLRVRVESLAFGEQQDTVSNEESVGVLTLGILGATVFALIVSGFAAWHLQRLETMHLVWL
eukprot:COSAG02_NODE_849_length_16548_cov_6.418384_17_plen_491_part_00